MHNGVDSIASAAKRRRPCQRLVQAALALLLAGATLAAAAIDNPDAPDRVAAFAARAAPLEAALAETSGGSAASQAGQAYAVFLDTELNTAYHALLARLQPPARQALVVSQRQWLRFRDAEQGFIGQLQYSAEFR